MNNSLDNLRRSNDLLDVKAEDVSYSFFDLATDYLDSRDRQQTSAPQQQGQDKERSFIDGTFLILHI
jgi:hypothetical protein